MIFMELGWVYFLAALSPGPSILMIIRNSSRGGGLFTSFGIILSNIFLLLLSVLGVNILDAHPIMFNSIRTIGAIYLIYIGGKELMKWKYPNRNQDIKKYSLTNIEALKQGFFVHTLNPLAQAVLLTIFLVYIPKHIPISEKSLYLLEIVAIDVVCYCSVALIISCDFLEKFTRLFFSEKFHIISSLLLIFLGIKLFAPIVCS